MRTLPLLLFSLLVFSGAVSAQADSLRRELAKLPMAEARFDLALRLARENARTAPPLAKEFGEAALREAGVLASDSLRILALTAIGNSQAKVDSVTAATSLSRALDLALQQPALHLRAVAHNNLGIFYKTYGNYPIAAEQYHAAITINEAADRPDLLADNYQNLAAALDLSGQRPAALGYLSKALALDSSRVTNEQRSRIWNSKGIVHCQSGDYQSGVHALQRALDFLPVAALYQRANTLNNLALAHQLLDDHPTAVSFNDRAADIADQLGDTSLLIRTLLGSIGSLIAAKDYAEADARISRGMAFADRLRSDKFRVSFLGERSKLATARGDHATALTAYRQQVTLDDKLKSEANINRLNELETRYQSKLKDQEIAAANQQLIHERSQGRRLLLLLMVLGLAVLSTLGLYAHRQRLQHQLERQDKTILEHQVAELRQQKDIDTLHAMMQGQEGERRRIARDLHDGISGLLAAAKLHFTPQPVPGRGHELLDQAAEDVRRIAHDLMPGALEKLGLVDATEEFIRDQQTENGPRLFFAVHGSPYRLGAARETSLFRIVQELLHNALKHAAAGQIHCRLDYRKNGVEISVKDDGKGMPDEQLRAAGMGLRSVAARVKQLRGRLLVEGEGGTRVVVEVSR